MAFDFPPSGGMSASSVKQLAEIDTEAIGFHALNGDAKVQLMQAWPSPPPPTSSLLAIASRRGLLAAGGPSAVVIASTEAVRDAFKSGGSDNTKYFTPQLTLELGTKISQVAFSSDERFLVISAEQGGGLAVYEVESLLGGNTTSSFELGTAQVSVRSLIPNPGEDTASLFALVTVNGQLMIADMKTRQISNPIREGVSCVAWSTKGKQLVAGLGDGSAVQMKTEGQVVKQIAKPPELEDNMHMSAILWLDNLTFMVVHTATGATDSSSAFSTFHIVITSKSANTEYQKIPEVVAAWGLERYPPSMFIQRMKDFPPDLKEVIILASTASEDVGVVTKSTKPLNSTSDASQVTDVFTLTTISNDARRAALPMADELTISSPIGMALDFSSKSPVHRPLPAEEMDESPTPLPALLILNNMGVLAGWWFTYAESIRTGTAYPGLVNIAQNSAPQQSSSAFGASNGSAFGAVKPATSGFGFSTTPASTTAAFGQTSGMGASQSLFGSASPMSSTKPTFGSTTAFGSNASTFGASNTNNPSMSSSTTSKAVFGATSGIGNQTSPWGSSSKQSGATAFGQTSSIGSVASPWAAAGSGKASTGNTGSIFGQNSGASQSSPFGSAINSGTTSGGFASFANTGGFSSTPQSSSVFASQTPKNNFGSNTDSGSVFGSTSTSNKAGGIFGSGTSTISLGSAWKNDQPDKPAAKADNSSSTSMFGTDFGKILGNTSEPQQATSEERDMEDDMAEIDDAAPADKADATSDSTTPAATPAPAKFSTIPPLSSGLFGTQAQQKSTPAEVQSSRPALTFSSTPPVKTTFSSDLPLPPDTTSKATFTPTTSSDTSTDSALKPTTDAAQSSSASPAPIAEKSPPVSQPSVAKTPTSEKPSEPVTPVGAPTPAQQQSTPFVPNSAKQGTTTTTTSSPFSFAKAFPALNKQGKGLSQPIDSPERNHNNNASTDEDGGDEGDEENSEGDEFDEEFEEEREDEREDEREEDREEGELEEGELAEEDEDESSVIDVGQEITAGADSTLSAKSSFGRQSSGLTDGSWANVPAPRSQTSQTKILGKIHFPPNHADTQRSPSPDRRLTPGFLRSEDSRSISAPNLSAGPKISLPRVMKQGQKTDDGFEQRQREERQRAAKAQAELRAQEEQPLVDDEDESVRRILESHIEPTRELEPFLAHQDYIAAVGKVGIPGQIERIYRDINSMIDTIGLNSRSIQAFTQGQKTQQQKPRGIDDLSAAKGWTLNEISELSRLRQELEATLQDAQLRQVPAKIAGLNELRTQIKNLLRQQKEISTVATAQIENTADDEDFRDLELSAEQQSQRQELRVKWKEFQDRLYETESAITMLKSKLTTVAAASRKGANVKVPTVEAVENTIRKMTKMAEEKSGDVDVLETQMRKLNMRPGSPSGSQAGSRQGSPFMTPLSSVDRHRSSLRSSMMSNTSPLRNSLHASIGGLDRSINSLTLDGRFGSIRNENSNKQLGADLTPFVRREQRSKIVMQHLRNALVGKNGEKSVKVLELGPDH